MEYIDPIVYSVKWFQNNQKNCLSYQILFPYV